MAEQILGSVLGWTPDVRVEVVEGRTLRKLVGYFGGGGTEPTVNVGKYEADGGWVTDPEEAKDFLGEVDTAALALKVDSADLLSNINIVFADLTTSTTYTNLALANKTDVPITYKNPTTATPAFLTFNSSGVATLPVTAGASFVATIFGAVGTFEKNRKGYSAETLAAPTFVFNSGTSKYDYTFSSIYVFTPGGGDYRIAGTSIALDGFQYLVASLTTPAFTPLNDNNTSSGVTAYAIPLTTVNFNQKGVFVLGRSYQGIFNTPHLSLNVDHWLLKQSLLDILKRPLKNVVVTRQKYNSLTWDFSTGTLASTSSMQYTLATGLVLTIQAFSVVVPKEACLLLTTDLTGATFVAPNENATGSINVSVYVQTAIPTKTRTGNGYFVLGACYFDNTNPAGDNKWYGSFPALVPDNYTPVIPIVEPSYNNVGLNASAIGTFITKWRRKIVDSNNILTLIGYGDSIWGREVGAEMSEASSNQYSPPLMYRNNIARKILDAFQLSGSNLKYFPVKNMTGFITQDNPYTEVPTNVPSDNSFIALSGTWINKTNPDFAYYRETKIDTSSITIDLTAGYSKVCAIVERVSTGATNIDVLVSVNGGTFVTPSSLGIGQDSFSCYRASAFLTFQRQYRVLWTGLNTASTYSFKFTKNDGSAVSRFIIWGMEAWDTPSLRMINAARGGNTIEALKRTLYDDVITTNYKPDAVIFELPMLNDQSQNLPDNTMDNLDIVLKAISEANIDVLCIIPHKYTGESAQYINFIRYARSYCAKYGIPCIDMYKKSQDVGSSVWGSWLSDGVHLSDAGVTSYFTEIEKVLLCNGSFGAVNKSPKVFQTGVGTSGVKVMFNTPYISIPKVTISPFKNGSTTPTFQYIDTIELDGFTVQGVGQFTWRSRLEN